MIPLLARLLVLQMRCADHTHARRARLRPFPTACRLLWTLSVRLCSLHLVHNFHRPWRVRFIHYIANPIRLGGNFDLRKIKLTSAHLAQTDKSMNARLWDFFPLEVIECMERMGHHDRVTRPIHLPLGEYTFGVL